LGLFSVIRCGLDKIIDTEVGGVKIIIFITLFFITLIFIVAFIGDKAIDRLFCWTLYQHINLLYVLLRGSFTDFWTIETEQVRNARFGPGFDLDIGTNLFSHGTTATKKGLDEFFIDLFSQRNLSNILSMLSREVDLSWTEFLHFRDKFS